MCVCVREREKEYHEWIEADELDHFREGRLALDKLVHHDSQPELGGNVTNFAPHEALKLIVLLILSEGHVNNLAPQKDLESIT